VALPPKVPGRPGAPPTIEDSIAAKHASDILADECGSAEEDLEALKARYEQYFLGIERREPARERGEMKRRVEKLKESFTKNAGLRFRLQTLHARFLSYERLWLRSTREKEAGTYRRDLLKARRKAAERAEAGEAPGTPEPPQAPPPDPTPSPATSPAMARARPPPLPAPTGPAPAMSDAELRVLYESYLAAKRSCNEDVSKVTLESIARTVNKQAPEIAAKFKAKRVEFKVAVRDGRAVLTAVPKT
jgi:hypothetical protein